MSMLVWANSQARIEQKRAIRSVVLKRFESARHFEYKNTTSNYTISKLFEFKM